MYLEHPHTVGEFEIRRSPKPGCVWITDLRSGEGGDFSIARFNRRAGFPAADTIPLAALHPQLVADFFAAEF